MSWEDNVKDYRRGVSCAIHCTGTKKGMHFQTVMGIDVYTSSFITSEAPNVQFDTRFSSPQAITVNFTGANFCNWVWDSWFGAELVPPLER